VHCKQFALALSPKLRPTETVLLNVVAPENHCASCTNQRKVLYPFEQSSGDCLGCHAEPIDSLTVPSRNTATSVRGHSAPMMPDSTNLVESERLSFLEKKRHAPVAMLTPSTYALANLLRVPTLEFSSVSMRTGARDLSYNTTVYWFCRHPRLW
jgi:hypothetical protein